MTQVTRDALKLGDFYHVGVAVEDLDRAIASLARFGMTAGPAVELTVPSTYRGQATVASVKAAFAGMGPIAIELVQPVAGASSIATFLHEHGEGVQHYGYRTPDIDQVVERARALGIEAEWLVEDEHGLAVAFLARDAFFGVSVELVRAEPPITLPRRS
jgi:hypothetical protein